VNRQITLQLSDRVIRRAESAASQTKRRIEEVLVEWLELLVNEPPVEELSDSDVLGLTQLKFSDEQQAELRDLLDRNCENSLDEQDRLRLDDLMRVYERGLLRKSQALRVAVQRGLLEPLQA
jgi:hypothetical protein